MADPHETIYEALCREFESMDGYYLGGLPHDFVEEFKAERDGRLWLMAKKLAEAGLTEWPPIGNGK